MTLNELIHVLIDYLDDGMGDYELVLQDGKPLTKLDVNCLDVSMGYIKFLSE